MSKNMLYFGTGASSAKDKTGLQYVMRAALENGIRYFDTAPSYKTESLVGEVLEGLSQEFHLLRSDYFVQTKIDPWQMQDGNIRKFVEDACHKLRLEYIDSVLIHWPVPDYMAASWKELVQAWESGLVKRIGVCNVRTRQLKNMLNLDTPPQIVQIERHPLRTCKEEIAICHDNGIEVQAYSALCKMDERIKDNKRLQEMAALHGKNVGQLVLRWHIDTGVIPIFTSKKAARIKEYTEIFDFSLNDEEIQEITGLNEDYKMYLESLVCPGF